MTTGSSEGPPAGDPVPLREIFGEGSISTDVMPNFAVVIRGYERNQVDGYVAELLTALEETRAHLEDAQTRHAALADHAGDLAATVNRHQALPAFADLGDHISTMMATAAEESETMRRRAEEEALDIVNRAQEQGHAILRAADERSTDVRAKAERLHTEGLAAKQRAIDDATREAAALVADGERRRREMLAAAEALMLAATEEVIRIRATRDLGAVALDELSGVLARVAAESRATWHRLDGTEEEPAEQAAEAEVPQPEAEVVDVTNPAAEAVDDTDGPEKADETADAPADDTEKLINLAAEDSPSPTRRVR